MIDALVGGESRYVLERRQWIYPVKMSEVNGNPLSSREQQQQSKAASNNREDAGTTVKNSPNASPGKSRFVLSGRVFSRRARGGIRK